MADAELTRKNENSTIKTQEMDTATTYIPDVDIYEDGGYVHVVADMPGADQASVEVTVENNVLTLMGDAHVDSPEGYELMGQEYYVGKYRRDFTLGEGIDTERIKAQIKYGVLEITIPLKAEARKRKIKIGGE